MLQQIEPWTHIDEDHKDLLKNSLEKQNILIFYFYPKPTQRGFMVQKSWESKKSKISHLATFKTFNFGTSNI